MSRHSTLTALILAASLPLIGCDTKTSTADESILHAIRTAGPATQPSDGVSQSAAMESLMKNQDASPARRALGKSALAGSELQTGLLYLAQVDLAQAQIHAKLFEMEQQALQIAHNKVVIAAARQRDPAKPVATAVMNQTVLTDVVNNRAAEVRGGKGDAPWLKGDPASLATLSAVKQTVSTLTDQIAQSKATLAKLTQDRDKALTDAAQAQRQSDAGEGASSSTQYMRAVDLRKQAAMLEVQIQQARAASVPLEQNLAAAQAHEKAANTAVEVLDALGKVNVEQYAEVSTKADELASASKSMIDGDKASLKEKAGELAAMQKNASATRDQAIEQLKAAIQHYADAVRESDALKGDKKDFKPGSVEAALNDEYLKTHDSVALRLRQAEAQGALGSAQTSYAVLLNRKLSMIAVANTAATALAVQLPAEVADNTVADALKQALTLADVSYRQADDLLQNVASGIAPPSSQATAEMLRVAVNIGWAQVANLQGLDKEARDRMSTAANSQQAALGSTEAGLPEPRYLRVITNTLPRAGSLAAPAPATMPTSQPTDATPPVEAPAGGGALFGNPPE